MYSVDRIVTRFLVAFFFQVEKGIRFLGDSYAAAETGQAQMVSLQVTFKTLSPSGVLVYSGEVTFD